MALLGFSPKFHRISEMPSISLRRIAILSTLCLVPIIAMGCAAATMGDSTGAQGQSGPQNAIQINSDLPQASIGSPYDAALLLGVHPEAEAAIVAGSLPPGLRLNASKTSIAGTPATVGVYRFLVEATNGKNNTRRVQWAQVIVQSETTTLRVTLSPTSVALPPGGQQQFSATVQGTSNSGVKWYASAGSISASGLFVAPATESGLIVVTATSTASPSTSATSSVRIMKPDPLVIETSSIPNGETNSAYDASLSASGGVPPYRWSMASGTLPAGIQLTANGALSGTSSAHGEYPISVRVTDSASANATQSLSLSLNSVSTGNYDGPAELPRVYLQTTLADTPAPGKTVSVSQGEDLQTAFNNATCGETIELQAGALFSGQFTLPAKGCDDQHWIIIRTSTPDSALPPEGTRMTPCQAGIGSLPGRPSFPCSNPQKLLATLSYAGTGSGPIFFENGASYYRLLGLEVTRITHGMAIANLISVGTPSDHLVFDRLYVHGTAKDETRRGLQLGAGTNVAVQDSYFSDFHCAVGGSCQDSQSISGGTGSLPMGPYKIEDNFLEAAGENIIFGGGPATVAPTDIQISRNHFFKPLTWMKGTPGFMGMVAIVKNHLELKNAQRVLVDGNVMENSWGGFSQAGFSIVVTPKNQDSGSGNICPLCQVSDVVVRNGTISHVGGGIVLANALAVGGEVPLQGQRYSVHDLIVDDIDPVRYNGHGVFVQVSTIPKPLLQHILISHITAFPPHALLNVGGPNTVRMDDFTFTNSVFASGEYPILSTGAYGSNDCAHWGILSAVINQCFAQYTFSHNAFLDVPPSYPPSAWPSGNFFYSDSSIEFVNYNGGNGGDYHLLPGSPGKGAATDGTDLGANIDGVQNAIAGIR